MTFLITCVPTWKCWVNFLHLVVVDALRKCIIIVTWHDGSDTMLSKAKKNYFCVLLWIRDQFLLTTKSADLLTAPPTIWHAGQRPPSWRRPWSPPPSYFSFCDKGITYGKWIKGNKCKHPSEWFTDTVWFGHFWRTPYNSWAPYQCKTKQLNSCSWKHPQRMSSSNAWLPIAAMICMYILSEDPNKVILVYYMW